MSEQRLFKTLTHRQDQLCAGIATAAAAYSAWVYVGPYRWVAEGEMAVFGAYEVKITFLVAMMLIYAALGLVGTQIAAFQSDVSGRTEAPVTDLRDTAAYRFLLSGFGQFVLIAAGFVVVGAYQYITGVTIGAREQVALTSLEAQSIKPPTGRWWQIDGEPMPEEAQLWEENHSKNYYVPLVSKSWKPGTPVRVVLLVKGLDFERLKKTRPAITGLIDPSGLSSQVIEHWQSDTAPVDSSTMLLAFNDSPEKRISMGKFFAAGGSVLLLLLGSWKLISNRHRTA